eukprot:PITA_34179
MHVHLLAQGYKVWETIEKGFTSTLDEQGKKNMVYDAKAKDLIINGLIEFVYLKVLSCKTAKKVWGKLENIYASDSQLKESKLQIFRVKFEQLRMKEDEDIVAYFQHVDETTNKLEGLGELVNTKTIVQMILRTLPTRLNPKVSVLEDRMNLTNLSIDELHEIITTYEMTIEEEDVTSHLGTTFVASKKTTKCPHINEVGTKGKQGPRKYNKQGMKKWFKKSFFSKEDNSSSDEDSDNEEEINGRVLFMAKHNKQDASDKEGEEEMTEVEFQNEVIRVIKELKAEKKNINTLEDELKIEREHVLSLKIKVEECK